MNSMQYSNKKEKGRKDKKGKQKKKRVQVQSSSPNGVTHAEHKNPIKKSKQETEMQIIPF